MNSIEELVLFAKQLSYFIYCINPGKLSSYERIKRENQLEGLENLLEYYQGNKGLEPAHVTLIETISNQYLEKELKEIQLIKIEGE